MHASVLPIGRNMEVGKMVNLSMPPPAFEVCSALLYKNSAPVERLVNRSPFRIVLTPPATRPLARYAQELGSMHHGYVG